MLPELVFSSDDLPAPDRFDAWRELMSSTHAPMRLESDRAADFWAHQRVIELGAVSVWPATYQQVVFIRTPELIRTADPETFHLSFLMKGEAGAIWDRVEKSYGPRDFHFNDSSRSYRIQTGVGPISSVGVEVPRALLPMQRGRAELAVGRHMSAQEGIGGLLAHFLTQLARGTSAYLPADGPRLGTVLTDLMAALVAHALDAEAALAPETRTRELSLRIKDFIRRNLHDSELTPSRIAEAHHISPGYLHRLFRAEAETVAAYVRRKRLEGARRDLADPALTGTPIHVIAARWGFPRATDFTRAFRAVYGITPKDHRYTQELHRNAVR